MDIPTPRIPDAPTPTMLSLSPLSALRPFEPLTDPSSRPLRLDLSDTIMAVRNLFNTRLGLYRTSQRHDRYLF